MAAVTATGTKFSIDNGVTDIAQVLSVTPVNVSLTTIETTDLDATWKTFMTGLSDGGECAVEIAYDPNGATHQSIIDAMDGAASLCKITYSDSTFTSFMGFVTGFSPSVSVDDKLTASVAIKITGTVTHPD